MRDLVADADRQLTEEEHLAGDDFDPAVTAFIRCRGCGCTDDRACIDADGMACCWLEVSPETGLGLCSACCPPGAIR